jgi:hypothetical protein
MSVGQQVSFNYEIEKVRTKINKDVTPHARLGRARLHAS